MRTVFMGTPDFAVPILTALWESPHEVAAVITQPDKPKGRGKAVAHPPVKEKALEYGIPVYQPQRVKEEEFIKELKDIAPEVIIVAAFGQILPDQILKLPKYGCMNVHASLLPRLRGAAPIQWAVMNGEEKSGVTIMQMNAGLDTGDMLLKKEIKLVPDETGGSLHDKLMGLGGPLLLEALERLEQGILVGEKQDDALSSYAKMLDKKLGDLDFSRPAEELERLIRGLNPWPSAYTKFHGKTLKIWKACVEEESSEGKPGEILRVEHDCFLVQTGKGSLSIWQMQLEGKRRMDTADFLRGYPLKEGEILPS